MAEMHLRVADRLWAMHGALENAEQVLRAQAELKFARAELQIADMQAAGCFSSAQMEHFDDLTYRPFLAQAKQSRATFLAIDLLRDDCEDGWSWPVRVMEAGPCNGHVVGLEGRPTYLGAEVVPSIVTAVEGVRFRRRHPIESEEDGLHLPELTIGWMSGARADAEGKAVYARANLLRSAGDIREMLMAAREARKLALFSVSMMARFNYTGKEIDGKFAHVATGLVRFIAVDMCAEPGAGGRFMQ